MPSTPAAARNCGAIILTAVYVRPHYYRVKGVQYLAVGANAVAAGMCPGTPVYSDEIAILTGWRVKADDQIRKPTGATRSPDRAWRHWPRQIRQEQPEQNPCTASCPL